MAINTFSTPLPEHTWLPRECPVGGDPDVRALVDERFSLVGGAEKATIPQQSALEGIGAQAARTLVEVRFSDDAF